MSDETSLGRTLIICNPAAQSGAAAEVGEQLKRFLEMYLHDGSAFNLVCTERPHHATQLASRAMGYDTVLAVGGDGIVHETANGLMRIEAQARPALGVIPVGSGNDYARTLGMREISRDRDLAAILSCKAKPLDVGRIEYTPADTDEVTQGSVGRARGARTEYFVQTLSFGMDAAIALGTYRLRASTGLTGTPLYLASGFSAAGRRYRDYPVMASIDGAPAERMRTIAFAVQIGPTYGSGFRICPDADPADGMLDICYIAGPMPRAHALALLLAAKGGHHRSDKAVHTRRIRSATFTFEDGGYPIQADGELIRATRVSVGILPGVLRVLVPTEGRRRK